MSLKDPVKERSHATFRQLMAYLVIRVVARTSTLRYRGNASKVTRAQTDTMLHRLRNSFLDVLIGIKKKLACEGQALT